MPPSCHGDLHRLLQISGRPMCVVKLLQLVLNAPTCLVFNQQRQAQVSPLLTDWLLAAARIKLKPLLTLGLLAGSAPSDVSNLCTHSAPRRLAKSCVPTRPSKLFSYLVLQWWNNFLSSVRAGAPLSSFKKALRHTSFENACSPKGTSLVPVISTQLLCPLLLLCPSLLLLHSSALFVGSSTCSGYSG